jgi:hypothetical protein
VLISALASRAVAVQDAGFWCSSVAAGVRDFPLGDAIVDSADDAISWIRRRLHEIAVQLDPPAVRIVSAWLSDQQRYVEALAFLSESATRSRPTGGVMPSSSLTSRAAPWLGVSPGCM